MNSLVIVFVVIANVLFLINFSFLPTTPEALMIVADIIRQNDTYDRCEACGNLLSALDMTGTYVKDPLYLLGEAAFVIPDSTQLNTPDALKTHILADCLEQQSVAQQNCLSLLTQTETELVNFASSLFHLSLTENPLILSHPNSESMVDPEELPNWERLGGDYAKEYLPEVGPLGFEQGRRSREHCPVNGRPLLLPATKNVREHFYSAVWYLQYPLHQKHTQYCFPFCEGRLPLLDRWRVAFFRWYAVNNIAMYWKDLQEVPTMVWILLNLMVASVYFTLKGVALAEDTRSKNTFTATYANVNVVTSQIGEVSKPVRSKGRRRN